MNAHIPAQEQKTPPLRSVEQIDSRRDIRLHMILYTQDLAGSPTLLIETILFPSISPSVLVPNAQTITETTKERGNNLPTPLVDHRDESAPGVVVVRVLLHVLGEVHDLLSEDGHHDAGRARVLLVLAPLELGGLPGKLVEVSLHADARVHTDVGGEQDTE